MRPQNSALDTYVFVLKRVFRFPFSISGWIIFGLLSAFMSAIPFKLFGILVDDFSHGTFQAKIGAIVEELVLVLAIRHLSTIFQTFLAARVSNNVIMSIRKNIFDKLVVIDAHFVENQSSSVLMSRIMNGSTSLDNLVRTMLQAVFLNVITMLIVIAYLLRVNITLTLLAVIPIPILLLLSSTIFKRTRTLWGKSWFVDMQLRTLLSEWLMEMRVIRVFGQQNSWVKRLNSLVKQSRSSAIKAHTLGPSMFSVISFTLGLMTALIWYLGATRVSANIMTVGQFTSFIGWLGQLYAPVSQVGRSLRDALNSSPAIMDIFSLLETPVRARVRERQKLTVSTDSKLLEMDGVYFKHEHDSSSILINASMAIAHGERVALIGESGSGKSTIVGLITAQYMPDKGRIIVLRHPVGSYTEDNLANIISVVPQQPTLISGTIAENIKFGRAVTREEVIHASIISEAHEFIMRLPDKYDTLIGTRKLKLSGGQIQRICIARALIGSPKLVVFDEATSGLDIRTEEHLMGRLRSHYNSTAFLLITHRITSLQYVDKVIELRNQTLDVVEKGSITRNSHVNG